MHYCGNATHQAENFLKTEGLLAINTYTLYDLKAFKELKAKLEGRIVVFACDFTPLEYENYFAELLTDISFRGLIICSAYSPVVCLLKGGKYDAVRQDLHAGRRAVFEHLRSRLARLSAKG